MEKVDDEESRGFDARNVNRAKFVRLLSIDTGDRVSGTRLGNRVGITVAEFRIGIFFYFETRKLCEILSTFELD